MAMALTRSKSLKSLEQDFTEAHNKLDKYSIGRDQSTTDVVSHKVALKSLFLEFDESYRALYDGLRKIGATEELHRLRNCFVWLRERTITKAKKLKDIEVQLGKESACTVSGMSVLTFNPELSPKSLALLENKLKVRQEQCTAARLSHLEEQMKNLLMAKNTSITYEGATEVTTATDLCNDELNKSNFTPHVEESIVSNDDAEQIRLNDRKEHTSDSTNIGVRTTALNYGTSATKVLEERIPVPNKPALDQNMSVAIGITQEKRDHTFANIDAQNDTEESLLEMLENFRDSTVNYTENWVSNLESFAGKRGEQSRLTPLACEPRTVTAGSPLEHQHSILEEPLQTRGLLQTPATSARVTFSRPIIQNSSFPDENERSYVRPNNFRPQYNLKDPQSPVHIFEPYRSYDSASIHLAIAELKKAPSHPYSGEPHLYYNWVCALENRMNPLKEFLTPMDVIDILEAHSVGRPREVINIFKISGGLCPEETLCTIRKKLNQRFGAKEEISKTLIRKVLDFPEINGRQGEPKVAFKLRAFGDICRVVLAHIDKVPDLQTLNYSAGYEPLRRKLPEFLQNKWRMHKARHFENNNCSPNFKAFCEFVEEYADILCADLGHLSAPEYQQNQYVNKNENFKNKSARTMKSNAIDTDDIDADFACPLHRSNSHKVSECEAFLKLDITTKKLFLRSYRLCFRCFQGHLANECQTDVKCDVCKSSFHPTAMHDYKRKFTNFNRRNASDNERKSQLTSNLNLNVISGQGNHSCSKTVLAEVTSPYCQKTVKTYCIIDEQSNRSFADPKLFELLDIVSPQHSYTLSTLSEEKMTVCGRIARGLTIKGVTEGQIYTLPAVYENDHLPDTRNEVATFNLVARHPSIRKWAKNFPPLHSEHEVLMLIGRDAQDLMATKVMNKRSPFVHHTALGWAVVGPLEFRSEIDNSEFISMKTSSEHDHFSVEMNFLKKIKEDVFVRNHDDDEVGSSFEDKIFLNVIRNNTVVNDKGFIQMPLPLKESAKNLPDNSKMVFKRQVSTLNKMKQDEVKLTECLSVMQKYMDAGHVEMVSDDQVNKYTGLSWHLPVFPVIHPKKRKYRLVFDSAAKYSGMSLNSVLISGPDQINSLRGVLLRFRNKAVGYVADIESMFHSFHVEPSHRNLMKFFWFKNNDSSLPLVQYRANVHIFGNTCSPSISILGLNKAADLYSENVDIKQNVGVQRARDYIKNNFYIDDGLGCDDTPEDAVTTLKIAREMLSAYNIRLHKIVSNSAFVTESFPAVECAELKLFEFDNSPFQRTLGIVWRVESDEFVIRVDLPCRPFTKRGILSVINSIYDPIGIVSPVTLKGKLFQRQIFFNGSGNANVLSQYEWDDELPASLLPQWKQWMSELKDLESLRLSRCFTGSTFGERKSSVLHVFSDASRESIGHVIYAKFTNTSNEIAVSYLYGESKVAPRGAVTIPRLELCAALDAVLSVKKLIKELPFVVDETVYYTDSLVVLGYIKNLTRRFTRYVTRRVDIIRSSSSSEQWKYVRTDDNPADIATRPHNPEYLSKSCWLAGPIFLKEDKEIETVVALCPDSLPEIVNEEGDSFTLFTNVNSTLFDQCIRRINNYCKVLIVVKLFLNAKALFLSKLNGENPNQPCLKDAERFLIREAQAQCFSNEIMSLSKDKSVVGKLAALSPFVDCDGILRVGGRLRNSEFEYAIKHPIILSADSSFGSLLLNHLHRKSGHQGRHVTLGAIREAGYFFTKAQSNVRKLISNCVFCRRLRAPREEQYMASLPADRFHAAAPFTKTGIDVMGPWYVRKGHRTRSNSGSTKIWCLLFTCLASRAVHVELLSSMDTSTFINSFRRFLAVRGPCSLIRSDCGTNFIGAIGCGEYVDEKSFQKFLEQMNCEWKFNPPHAAHFGGIWERKVGQIKRALEGALVQVGNKLLNYDEFATFMAEAVAIVNSTPLWEVSSDPNEPFPLTPQQLLTLKEPLICSESLNSPDIDAYGKLRWKKVQYLCEQFWRRWRRSYILNLQSRQKWVKKRESLRINDVVLLKTPNCKRNEWPMGVIVAVKDSNDGVVRTVSVKVARCKDGSTVKCSTLLRPISEVVLLLRP